MRIVIGLGDLAMAREAHQSLEEIAGAVVNDPLRAAERRAAGEIALAEDDAEEAARAFDDAVDLYRRSGNWASTLRGEGLAGVIP